MDINVNLNSIKNSIDLSRKNDNYFFIIDGNIFSIQSINTILNIKKEDNIFRFCNNSSFSFSYNDGCFSEMINVIYQHENYRCFNYVKNCKLISDEALNELWNKSFNIYEKKHGNSIISKQVYNYNEVDEIFYNEILLFISSKINENDKQSTIDDFKSKYELYKNEKIELIENTEKAFIELFNTLTKKVLCK